MVKAFLESLENPKIPLFSPNYGLMNKIGLLLPKKYQQKICEIIIHAFATYLELSVIRSDIDFVIINLVISMLSTICVIEANTSVFWQDNWCQITDYITDADKFERNNQDETKVNIINSYTKYCRCVTYIYWSLVFITFVTTVTTPLIKYYSSPEFREGFLNGTEAFPHIFSSWMPFDKDNYPGNWITILWHTGICAYGATIVDACDTSVMVVLVFFGGKLELLRIRCREILGMNGVAITDKQADRVIRELHLIHVLLLKYSTLLNSVLSPVIFFYVVMCSLLICASAYQLTSATNITQRFFITKYLVFGIAQLFMFCWHSNDVIYKSNEVMYGPYESEWWAANLQQWNKVLILQGQMKIVHIYKAGPCTNLTLPTFLAILKGAYSWYTLFSKK